MGNIGQILALTVSLLSKYIYLSAVLNCKFEVLEVFSFHGTLYFYSTAIQREILYFLRHFLVYKLF